MQTNDPTGSCERTSSQARAQSTPAVRAVLAAVVTFPVSTTSAPGRGQSQSVPAASLMRNPSRHSITITPRSLSPSGSSPAARMTRNDLLDGGRIRRVPKALVGWRKAPVETCEVCRRAAPAPARCDPVRIPCRPPLDDDRYGVTVLLSRRLHQSFWDRRALRTRRRPVRCRRGFPRTSGQSLQEIYGPGRRTLSGPR